MLHSRPHIEEGDLVIMYFTRDSMSAIIVTPGDHFHNKFGRYAHADMIGMKFGSKMHSPKPHAGYIYLLRPTPELWTLSLPHRTQILYQTDISYIIQRLGIRPGSRAVEAGTGSGSMTHSLSRTAGPRGKVYSFEYHQNRFEAAKKEFESHSLNNVEIAHRNVCKDGFADATNVDAVFLDLPAPWEAIPDTIARYNPDAIGRICCFSPCLEQVLKTVSTLREYKFEDIATVEVLTRSYEIAAPPPHNAPPRLRDITSIVSSLKEHEDRKQERRISQMKAAREKARERKEAAANAALEAESPQEVNVAKEEGSTMKEEANTLKRKHDELETGENNEKPEETAESSKKTKSEVVEAIDGPDGETNVNEEEDEDEETAENAILRGWEEPKTNIQDSLLTKPSYEMRGHTSYLTFALYYPSTIRQQLDAQDVTTTAPVSKAQTPVPKRVEEITGENRDKRGGSQETEYGDEVLDKVMGTMTEEDMMALGA